MLDTSVIYGVPDSENGREYSNEWMEKRNDKPNFCACRSQCFELKEIQQGLCPDNMLDIPVVYGVPNLKNERVHSDGQIKKEL